ncbi:MAG: hypothetical protein U1E78_01515 [Gammaproteobacteria bacterium]
MTENHQKSDYAHVLMIDYAETGRHLVSILNNQFKCYITVVSAQDEILGALRKKPQLILILDKKTGQTGPSVGRYIRGVEAEHQLKPTTIVVLLSIKTIPIAQSIDTTDIADYHVIFEVDYSLEKLMEQWLPSDQNQSISTGESDGLEEFDESVLTSLASLNSAGCGDLLQEAVQTFIDQYYEKINSIQFDWYKKDYNTIKTNAHFMKSSSYTMGANRLAKLFGDLEIHYIGDELKFKEKIEDIEACFQKAKKTFDGYVADSKSSQ